MATKVDSFNGRMYYVDDNHTFSIKKHYYKDDWAVQRHNSRVGATFFETRAGAREYVFEQLGLIDDGEYTVTRDAK